MKRCLIVPIVFCGVVFSCTNKARQVNSGGHNITLQVIRVCVDSILPSGVGFNNKSYLVDFSKLELDSRLIHSFLQTHPEATLANLDSLFQHDSTWIKYEFFQHPVIRFEGARIPPGKDLLVIDLFEINASDEAIKVEFIFRRMGTRYSYLSHRITAIS